MCVCVCVSCLGVIVGFGRCIICHSFWKKKLNFFFVFYLIRGKIEYKNFYFYFLSIIKYLIIFVLTIFGLIEVLLLLLLLCCNTKNKRKQFCVFVEKFKTFQRQQQQNLFTLSFLLRESRNELL